MQKELMFTQEDEFVVLMMTFIKFKSQLSPVQVAGFRTELQFNALHHEQNG